MTKKKVVSKVDTLKLDQFALLDRRLGRIEKAVKKNGAHELLQALDQKIDEAAIRTAAASEAAASAAAAAAASASLAEATHAKTLAVDTQLQTMAKQLSLIVDGLFGCEENPDRPGFFERVRKTEASIANAGKALWIAIGAMITSIVAILLKKP